jgi:hypothetical protein
LKSWKSRPAAPIITSRRRTIPAKPIDSLENRSLPVGP